MVTATTPAPADPASWPQLYAEHRDAARRVALRYRRGNEADDLVNGAFERVLAAVQRGAGPRQSFRAYLFVTLRRLALEEARRRGRDEPLPEDFERPAPTQPDGIERGLVARAFATLPQRWQVVLWHCEVEARPPREIAAQLGISANAVAALACRAREGLRQAYLQAHLSPTPTRAGCHPHRDRLGAFVRQGLSRRDSRATAAHLDDCARCRSATTELRDLNALVSAAGWRAAR